MRLLARFCELTNLGLPLASGRFQRARALYRRCEGAYHGGSTGAGKAFCVSLGPLLLLCISFDSIHAQMAMKFDVCVCLLMST